MTEIFNKRFLEAKEKSGLRWIDIAKKSGLDKAQISQYKNGVHVPEADALYKLAVALGVSMEWLTGADTIVNPNSGDFEILRRYHQLNDLGMQEFSSFLDKLLSDDRYTR